MSRSLLSDMRWKIGAPSPDRIRSLTKDLGLSLPSAMVLANRNLGSMEEVKRFLHPSLSHLHPPFQMLDMDRAVQRILEALDKQEKVVIYGDYDLDGVSATALLFLYFKEMGLRVDVYLPHRLREGYGLNARAVETLARRGNRLLVTVDCGISNHKEVQLAERLGMDVIVTDHHEPGTTRPPALAVINPKQGSCPFPDPHAAGVGVALNLIVSLRAALREKTPRHPAAVANLKSYLDLVALGTIADLVPLRGQNRIWVKSGLELLSRSQRPGIRALKEVAALGEGELTSEDVAFRLAPRLNAAGRIGDPRDAFDLLTTDSETKARKLARLLEEQNRLRKQEERNVLEQAITQVEQKGLESASALVVAGMQWHRGVIGIVAARLKERFYRPALVISVEDGVGHGSARSIPELNLYELLSACKQHLLSFGGHAAAAGFKVESSAIPSFTSALQAFLDASTPGEPPVPSLNIDGCIPLDRIDVESVLDLERLAPFGTGNAEPVFLSREVEVISSSILKESHLSLTLRSKSGKVYRAIGFQIAPLLSGSLPSCVDVVYTPFVEQWEGKEHLQLRILDLGV